MLRSLFEPNTAKGSTDCIHSCREGPGDRQHLEQHLMYCCIIKIILKQFGIRQGYIEFRIEKRGAHRNEKKDTANAARYVLKVVSLGYLGPIQ